MAGKKKRRIRWDRVFVVFGPIFLLIMILMVCCHKKDPAEAGSSSLSDTEPLSSLSADPNSEAEPVTAQPDDYLIVIDPGHGGNDGGALDTTKTRAEKDDNLRLALAVRDHLSKYPHISVILTRETDVFLELQERCDIANNANADVFVSLHRNSATDGDGVEVWVNNDALDNRMDKILGEYIMSWLKEAGISNDRGVHQGYRGSTAVTKGNNYYVNRNTTMPSALVEMGFMTSAIDNKNFDEKLEEYAEAIASALIELGEDYQIYNESAA